MWIPSVEPQKLKLRVPKLSTIGVIALISFTGFEYIESSLRHVPSAARHGVFFLIVIVVIVVTFIVFTERR
jgi:hypothetical protein